MEVEPLFGGGASDGGGVKIIVGMSSLICSFLAQSFLPSQELV